MSIACEEQLFLQATDNPKTAASKKSRAEITSYCFQLGKKKGIRKSYILQSQDDVIFHMVNFFNNVIQIKKKKKP